MESHETLYDDEVPHTKYLSGLARQCPSCKIIAHYEVKTRKKPVDVICPDCGHEFTVQKYRRGERPQRREK